MNFRYRRFRFIVVETAGRLPFFAEEAADFVMTRIFVNFALSNIVA